MSHPYGQITACMNYMHFWYYISVYPCREQNKGDLVAQHFRSSERQGMADRDVTVNDEKVVAEVADQTLVEEVAPAPEACLLYTSDAADE